MSGYIYVCNWETFQHYSGRRAPWMKLYADLLNNEEWLSLSPSDSRLLTVVWLLTQSYGNGRVRADQGWLRAQAKTPKGNLDALIHAGFIEVHASKAASKYIEREIESKKEIEREIESSTQTPVVTPPSVEPKLDLSGFSSGSTNGSTGSISEVWAHYQSYHPQAKFNDSIRKKIHNRLREGWTPAELKLAVDGNHLDPHCNGDNDRGKTYHRAGLIFGDAAHVQDYLETAQNPPRRPSTAPSSIASRLLVAAREMRNQEEATNGTVRRDGVDGALVRILPGD